jgi:long-chain acyl-CoA synthetase
MKRWLTEQNLDPGTTESKQALLTELRRQINEFRTGGTYDDVFPQRWLPASIVILPEPFSQENLQLNSMNKLVRNKVTEAYNELLAFAYTPEAKEVVNERNISNLGEL